MPTTIMPKHGSHARKRGSRGSTLTRFIDHDALSRVLAPFVPDDEDRSFVVRCLLDEGPAHHRGANWVLLMLLSKLAAQKPPLGPEVKTASVFMQLPPHIQEEREDEDDEYPLRLPISELEQLSEGDPVRLEAMIDCLVDGPPQHALANAAMVALLTQALQKS